MPGRVLGQAFARGTPGHARHGTAVRVRHLRCRAEAQGSLDQAQAEPQFREAVRLYGVRQSVQAQGTVNAAQGGAYGREAARLR